jgi:hypothetical protein
MKALINISGGAIKFIALISAFRQLLKTGVKPKAVSGVSSGAIICFLYVCGRLDQGLELARKSDDIRLIFSRKNQPVGKIAGFSIQAIWKLIRGKNYIGVMDNLEKNIKAICSPKDFWNYKENPEAPDCYLLAIDETTGRHVVQNIKHLSYNGAIDLVIGSSSIAPTIISREFEGWLLNDGGHRGHSAGAYLLRNNYQKLKERIDTCFTIFSRPHPEEYEEQGVDKTNNFFNRLLNFTIGISIKETSLNDEYVEREECEDSEIAYIPIYIPKFTNATYAASKEDIQKGEALGIAAVKEWYLEE